MSKKAIRRGANPPQIARLITSVCNEVKPHCKPLLCYSIAQDAAVLPALQDTFRLPLQLPDPLARDVQLVAEFGEGGRLAVVETVAPDEHVARPLGKTFDRLLQMLRLHLTHHGISRIRDLIVLDEVTQLRCGLLAGHRLIEARRVRHGAHREAHLVGVPVQASGHLFLGGLAFDLQGQLTHGAADLPDLLRHVHGDADGTALVRHRALYCLPDPPRGVRGEPEAPIRVELLYGLHQADVALLYQVLEWQPVAPVLFGNADHQPEVLLDEPLPGPPVAGLGPDAEIYLLPVRKEIALPDMREILGEELGSLRFPLDLLLFLPLLEIGFQNTLLTTHPSYRKSVLETTIGFTARFNFLNLSEVSLLTWSHHHLSLHRYIRMSTRNSCMGPASSSCCGALRRARLYLGSWRMPPASRTAYTRTSPILWPAGRRAGVE